MRNETSTHSDQAFDGGSGVAPAKPEQFIQLENSVLRRAFGMLSESVVGSLYEGFARVRGDLGSVASEDDLGRRVDWLRAIWLQLAGRSLPKQGVISDFLAIRLRFGEGKWEAIWNQIDRNLLRCPVDRFPNIMTIVESLITNNAQAHGFKEMIVGYLRAAGHVGVAQRVRDAWAKPEEDVVEPNASPPPIDFATEAGVFLKRFFEQ